MNRIIENVLLTIPCLFLGLICAVVAFCQPVILLWTDDGDE